MSDLRALSEVLSNVSHTAGYLAQQDLFVTVQGTHFFGNVVEGVDVRSPSQQPLPQHQDDHEPEERDKLVHGLTEEEGKVAHLKGTTVEKAPFSQLTYMQNSHPPHLHTSTCTSSHAVGEQPDMHTYVSMHINMYVRA